MPLPYENVSNPLVKPLQQVNLYDIPGPKKKFKIGLDYGTSYSAGAFCLCSNSEPPLTKGDIHPFYQLGGGSKGLPESSSAILYDGDSIFIGYDAEKHHKVGQGIIRRAKLGLDNRPETASAREALQKEIENLSNQRSSSIEVITDYLKIFFDGFKSRLIKVNYFRGDEIEMNCAVPSIWGDTARRSMVGAIRTAALRAGLDINPHVKLWPEAEAATEAYLRGVKRDRSAKDNPGLKVCIKLSALSPSLYLNVRSQLDQLLTCTL